LLLRCRCHVTIATLPAEDPTTLATLLTLSSRTSVDCDCVPTVKPSPPPPVLPNAPERRSVREEVVAFERVYTGSKTRTTVRR
jgi:hypothetical protein